MADGTRVVASAASGTTDYSVKFKETGLPTGTSWSIIIDGQSNTSNTNELNFSLPNGTYTVHAGYVPGYKTGKLAKVTVAGGPDSVTVKFSRSTYTVAFVETGLPKGAVWEVTLTPPSGPSTNASSNSTTIPISAPNGTYFYSISPIQGYKLSVGSLTGSVTVGGSNPSPIAVEWVASSSPKAGLSVLDYVAIGGVILLAGIVLVVLWLRHRNRTPPASPAEAAQESPPKDGSQGAQQSDTGPPESGGTVPP